MPWKLILHGSVQGVFCRHYCSQIGKKLGISGAASNLYDGTVQVFLECDDENVIKDYIKILKENTYKLRFYGRIKGVEAYPYTGTIEGDYIF